MNDFSLFVTYVALPGCREKFLREMVTRGILDAIRQEDGCLCYDYYLSVEEENTILLIERWASEAHQQKHMVSPHMADLRALKGELIADTQLRRMTLD